MLLTGNTHSLYRVIIAIVKLLNTFIRIIRRPTGKKAFRQLSLDDSNNHYNWVSMANSVIDQLSPYISESEQTVEKKKIRSTYNTTLGKT